MSVNENIHSEEGFTAQEQEAYERQFDIEPEPMDEKELEEQSINDYILDTIDESWADW
jgi:hypothetical protein